jgi:hypothetical protein
MKALNLVFSAFAIIATIAISFLSLQLASVDIYSDGQAGIGNGIIGIVMLLILLSLCLMLIVYFVFFLIRKDYKLKQSRTTLGILFISFILSLWVTGFELFF